jgi:hypothetical protein
MKTEIAYNTQYYRNNKKNKKIVHQCEKCNYSTTGPKIALKNHIMAKHTPESERPYQCEYNNCCRGFAQKKLLERHLQKIHNKDVCLTIDRTIVEFHVEVGLYHPASKATQNRVKYYLSKPNGILYQKDLKNFEFLPGKIINKNHIYYDAREGYINLQTYNEHQIYKKRKRKKKTIIL